MITLSEEGETEIKIDLKILRTLVHGFGEEVANAAFESMKAQIAKDIESVGRRIISDSMHE